MLNKFKVRLIALISSLALLPACAGERPLNLGVFDGKLRGCPSSPNCVSSFAPDEKHKIASFRYSASKSEMRARLKSVLEKMEGTKIVIEKDNYLYAEFTSKLFRFVDDVEFLLDDETKSIHFRSASRLGRSDFGVNRKRIESIKSGLALKPGRV